MLEFGKGDLPAPDAQAPPRPLPSSPRPSPRRATPRRVGAKPRVKALMQLRVKALTERRARSARAPHARGCGAQGRRAALFSGERADAAEARYRAAARPAPPDAAAHFAPPRARARDERALGNLRALPSHLADMLGPRPASPWSRFPWSHFPSGVPVPRRTRSARGRACPGPEALAAHLLLALRADPAALAVPRRDGD
jgi:hypothetical protein